jgi:cell wall-associated NlpC family hydrolase
MRKTLGCTVLTTALVAGMVLPAAGVPTTDRSTGSGTSGPSTVQVMALSPNAAARQRPTLRVGSRTPAVVYVQRTLAVRPTSGYYGPITRAAVTRLQRTAGLRATGTVDKATWKVLLAAKGVIQLPSETPATPATPPAPATPASPTPASPTPAPPTPAPPATPPAATPAPAPALTPQQAAAARPSLRYGMGPADPAVVFVQQFLKVTPASGYFGTRTRTAVTAYQRGLGIDAIGVVGPRTWAAIHAGTRPTATPSTPATTPTPPVPATPASPPPAPASPTAPPAQVANRIPTPVHPLPPTPAARDHALAFALAQVGKRYVLGGNGPDVWDCSGLIQQAYLRAGVRLPRLASQQRFAGTEVSIDQLLPGDLLYYQDGASPRKGHISMYAGNGLVVEAANPRRGVRMRTLHEAWYRDRFVAAVRVG